MSTQSTVNNRNSTGKGKPSLKVEQCQPRKRPNTEVHNTTAEEITLLGEQLDSLTGDVSSIRDSLKTLMTKDDIEDIVSKTVSKLLQEMEKRLSKEFEHKLKEETKILNEKIDSLNFENEMLREKHENLQKAMNEKLQQAADDVKEQKLLARDAMKKANYNEQYSRKNNIKIMGITSEQAESINDIQTKVLEVFQKQGVTVSSNEILAIHRIPIKYSPKPVLVKLVNNDVKTRIMRQRKTFKDAGHRVSDDVTKLNSMLINRLNNHDEIENAWFFNGSVYATSLSGIRHKFDLYDVVSQILTTPHRGLPK